MRIPTVRLYPGEDDDIIKWLEGLGRSKALSLKAAIRAGMNADYEQPFQINTAQAQLDPDSLISAMRREILPDFRQIIETILEERTFTSVESDEEKGGEDVLDGVDFGGLMI